MKKRLFGRGGLFFTVFSLFSGTTVLGAFTPDFLVLGVTKCGTSSLYNYMTEHPKILGANQKELHFFDTHRYNKGMAGYKKLFPAKKSYDQLIGEATPGYFWKKLCLRKIYEHCPQTKLIVIVRDPVKRVISEYFRLKRRGEESLGFDEAILQRNLRARYIGAGLYIEHLERWLKLYPREQILVLILEDLAKNQNQEVNKVFKFLGLEEHTLKSSRITKQAKYDMKSIRPETIARLKRFYAPYNKKLEKFLGRKLPWGDAK